MPNAATLRGAWRTLAQPGHWLLFLAGYLVLHAGMRLLLSDTLQLDDAEQLVQSQQLRLDYGNFQPPFHTWLLWGLWQLIEPQMWVLYLLRYLIIGASLWVWYRVSLLLFDDPRWQLAAASSWLLLPEFAWKLHQGSTHTTLLTLALIMSLHAMVLILRSPQTRHYLYLGLAVGLGMMAKYSYAGFVLPMLLAGLSLPASRARLLRWPMLAALLVAALAMLPALLSLFAADAPVVDRLQGETSSQAGGLLHGDASLWIEVAKGALAFLAPLWLVYLWLFRVRGGVSGSDAILRRLLDRYLLLVLLGALLLGLFVGIDHLKARWLHPFLTFVPFWWLLHAVDRPQSESIWMRLQWVTVGLLVLVVIARGWQLLASPYLGKKPSRVTWPVTEALRQLPEPVLRAPALHVPDTFVAAHLRLQAQRPVDVREPGGDNHGVWLWGGLDQSLPAWAQTLVDTTGSAPRWVMAERGKARFWVGYIDATD